MAKRIMSKRCSGCLELRFFSWTNHMPNRLTAESSPYLLQHANNPVDWYPWSDEALARAKAEDKPIFLSIGYAACHWCHVMEHESFESVAVADYLNQHFISIKVDREERPDLDQVYMQAVMALRGGQGGWPLSAFLTPDQEVFFGGTYWPPAPRHGLPGFDHVLEKVVEAFRERRSEITAHAKLLTEHLQQSLAATGPQEQPDGSLLVGAARILERNFDFPNGGFGTAPKFPHPMDLSLLLRLWSRWPSGETPSADRLRSMVELNLKHMAHGGIFDHLGGGFARYTVDAQWLVPHFEKMLYDNGLLASVYVDAWRAWGNEFYAVIARKTLDYLLRDMRDPAGGFHSSEDADSEGEEGKFYVWSQAEILAALGADGPQFCELYGVTGPGNFEGHNILYLPHSLEEFSKRHSIDPNQLRTMARSARAKLFEIRNRRIRPGKDDKVLANWNGLAIEAFAKAAMAFDSADYLAAAIDSAEFIWTAMRDGNGQLWHVFRRGNAKQAAFLDDFSYMIHAFIALYQANWDGRWLDRAGVLANQMIEDFADRNEGGFFYTAAHSPSLIARWKEQHDSSVPSGNSLAALALLRLGLICQHEPWLELGRQTVEASVVRLKQSPAAGSQMMIAVESLLDQRKLVVLVSPTDDGTARAVARKFQRRWSPHLEFVLYFADASTPDSLQSTLHEKLAADGQLTAYICEAFSCRAPISGIAAIESTLEQLAAERKRLA